MNKDKKISFRLDLWKYIEKMEKTVNKMKYAIIKHFYAHDR